MNQNVQYGNIYNHNWRNHPNFSWGANQNNRPQAIYNQPPKPLQQVEESLSDMMKKLLIENQKAMAENQQVRVENQQLRIEFKNLERQFGQMANNQNIRPVGALPGDIEKNLQVNAVILRNGRELVKVPKKKKESSGLDEERVPKPVEIHLSIPLVDMLRDVPKYTKYIMDIVANKKRLTEFETVALIEECTSRIQYKLPQKLKDLGSFTIPVRIGEIDVGRALCDLGASINSMSLSVFKQLGLGAPIPIMRML
nr:uncharacterized protein LOC104103307 [Nicotiana tomentosiformis]